MMHMKECWRKSSITSMNHEEKKESIAGQERNLAESGARWYRTAV